MSHSSFCSYRWTYSVVNLQTCEVGFCCKTSPITISPMSLKQQGNQVFANSSAMIERRKEMLQNIRHLDCSYCWDLEKKNIYHLRKESESFQTFSSKFFKRSNSSSIYSESEVLEFSKVSQITTLEIIMSNICNMKCHYCNENFSSSWKKELEKYDELPNLKERPDDEFNAKFREEFWLYFKEQISGINKIVVLGGEPLLQNDFFKLLDQIQLYSTRKKDSRLQLRIITNLSVDSSKVINLLNSIKVLCHNVDFVICPSMESIENKAEYIRYGLDWNLFSNNLQLILDSGLNFELDFITTINALNISSLSDFFKYIENLKLKYPKQKISITQNVVSHPSFLSPLVLTNDFNFYIKESIDVCNKNLSKINIETENFVKYLEDLSQYLEKNDGIEGQENRIKLKNWIDKWDGRRKTNFFQIFPEYRLLLSQ